MTARRYVGLVIVVTIGLAAILAYQWMPASDDAGPTRVAIQLNWFPDAEHAYLYLGKNLKIFQRAGFDVSIRPGRGSELSGRILAANDAEFALVGPDALLALRAQGAALVSLGVVYSQTPVAIYSLESRGILAPSDLLGKRLGVLLGSNTYTQYEGWAKIVGLSRDQVEEVPVDGRSAPELLNAGKIDALTFYSHYIAGFEVQYGQKYSQIKFLMQLPMYGMAFATSNSVISRLGSQKIEAFTDAVRESLRSAAADPTAAITALSAASDTFNQAAELAELHAFLALACHDVPDCSNALEQSDDGWRTTNDTVRSLGLISSSDIYRELIWRPG